MVHRFPVIQLLAATLACAMLLLAQPLCGAQAETDAPVSLGRSVLSLNGPWKFHIGDSPIDQKTGMPLWAEPDFDDSAWEQVDLTPASGTVDPYTGQAGWVPGWTTRGHAGQWGFGWYRIRVRLNLRPGDELAVIGPTNLDDGYQVFDNGKLAGNMGDFTGDPPVTGLPLPMLFRLPQLAVGGVGPTTQVLAFRFWMHPGTLTFEPDVGGFHNAPVLGEANAAREIYRMHWVNLVQANAAQVFAALAFAVLALMAFSLILFDRSDLVYAWMGTVFLLWAGMFALACLYSWTPMSGLTFNLSYAVLDGLVRFGWVMVWWIWFGRQRPSWLPVAGAALAVVHEIAATIALEQFFTVIPHSVASAFHIVDIVARLLLFAIMVVVVAQGIRRHGVEGWLVLPAVLLLGIASFGDDLNLLHIRLWWFPFGVAVSIGTLGAWILVLALVSLLLRRLLLSLRRQRQMALDVKQAREVQQVILPEARVVFPGLVIESEYRPAREVGGDFFQIIPNKSDGSVLIVAGDVAGKGLQAGMLVALLVGAVRMAAETNDDPEQMLRALNRRLLGRADAASTCLAIRVQAGGTVVVANAGHPVPYLNGDPLEMEGALPLGIVDGVEPSLLRFELKAGDRLMLISDGIIEAADARGQLLGFERVHELMRTARSAADIARSAVAFGQDDDITVISVLRTVDLEPATA